MNQNAKLERAKEIQAAIANVLLREWDPIGVKNEHQARDEYDRYVGGVYRLLASGASPQKVAEHLCKVEAEWMGFTRASPSQLLPVAEKLCGLDVGLHEERGAGEQ
jgi:hypothetical protein